MAQNVKYATVTGNVAKVEELVTAGSITPGYLCITSVGDKLCFVRPDNTVSVLSNEDRIFESMEDAENFITDSNEDVKAGQIVVIKDGDTYKQYVVNPGAEGGFELGEIAGGASGEGGAVWEEF